MKLQTRVERLEAASSPATPTGPIVFVDVVQDGHQLPPDEQERRIDDAQRAAGPYGRLIIVDCPTCGGGA